SSPTSTSTSCALWSTAAHASRVAPTSAARPDGLRSPDRAAAIVTRSAGPDDARICDFVLETWPMTPPRQPKTDLAGPRRLPAGRQAEVAAYVSSVGEVTVADLAERFGVSMDTVRRDLDRLHADG